jgi:hypothetical protein
MILADIIQRVRRTNPLTARVFKTLLVLWLTIGFANLESNGQGGIKRPALNDNTQQHSNANTVRQKPPKKNISPLHSGDTTEGSRITITSDAALNDYSAYRSGDRYYVIIPDANAPRAQAGLRGRGFEDVQVQKRGNDAILSVKLQPGTNVRTNQHFNRLDIEITAPSGAGQNTATGTPNTTTTPEIFTTVPTPRATPESPNNSQANNAMNSNANSTSASPSINGQGATQEQGNAAPAKRPLRKEQLIEALHVGGDVVSSSEFVRRIQERGVDFELTPTIEEELRAAGASPEMIEAIRANYRQGSPSLMTEKTSSTATSPEETSATPSTAERHTSMVLYIALGAIVLAALLAIFYAFYVTPKKRRLNR